MPRLNYDNKITLNLLYLNVKVKLLSLYTDTFFVLLSHCDYLKLMYYYNFPRFRWGSNIFQEGPIAYSYGNL